MPKPDHPLYSYQSPIGTFWIAPQPGRTDRFDLGIDGETIASYPSPAEAADDVCTHVTGYARWDARRNDVSDPTNLDDWTRGAQGQA